MSEYYDIKKPLPIMFDMLKGRLQEIIDEDNGTEPAQACDSINGWFEDMTRLAENAIRLLEPFAYPPSLHVKMSPDGIECTKCGQRYRIEDLYFNSDGKYKLASELATDIKRIISDHSGCLPYVKIQDEIQRELVRLGHSGTLADVSALFLIGYIKAIVSEEKRLDDDH